MGFEGLNGYELVFRPLEEYFRAGGPVLWALLALGLILLMLILERALYLWLIYKPRRERIAASVNALDHPYHRLSRIGEIEKELQDSFAMIKCLISLCPLLGLLGTVSGMITLFDTMAIQGTGNARLMASGVARTVYPTLTGMSLALITLLLTHPLEQYSRKERQRYESLKLENIHATA